VFNVSFLFFMLIAMPAQLVVFYHTNVCLRNQLVLSLCYGGLSVHVQFVVNHRRRIILLWYRWQF